jgi:hypothetical protein
MDLRVATWVRRHVAAMGHSRLGLASSKFAYVHSADSLRKNRINIAKPIVYVRYSVTAATATPLKKLQYELHGARVFHIKTRSRFACAFAACGSGD